MSTDVADEAAVLYALPPGEFVAHRDARAKELRSDDRPLADAVKALRRPSVAAWAVNQLVRERAELVDQVLALGVSLRQAQASLQGDQLRELNRQRRSLVASVARETQAVAAPTTLSAAVLRQVEDTLTAAMVDESAAVAVRSGTLTESLASTGMGSLGLAQVVGVLPGRLRAVPDPEPADPETAERDQALALLEEASSLLSDAERRLEKAAKKKAKREAKLLQLRAELEELQLREAELTHRIEQVADEHDAAGEAHAAALARRDEAKRAAGEAAKRVARGR